MNTKRQAINYQKELYIYYTDKSLITLSDGN